jgi:hypothetical protein
MKTLFAWPLCFAMLATFGVRTARADEPTLTGLEDEASPAAREAVLKSREWRSTMESLQRWLSKQQMYSKAQVSKFVRQFNAKIENMSAEELTDQMHTIESKMAVITSPKGNAAKRFFRDQLSLASDEYAAKMKKKAPDLAMMSADDIQTYLDNLEIRGKQTAKANTMREQGRAQQAETLKEMKQQQRDTQDKALDRAYNSANYGGGYYGGSPLGYQMAPTPAYNPGRAFGYRW